MNGEPEHKVEVTIRGAWSRGTLKLILALLTGAGGLFAFWDKIAPLFATAPVWLFIAVFALCFPFSVIAAPYEESPYPLTYDHLRGVLACPK